MKEKLKETGRKINEKVFSACCVYTLKGTNKMKRKERKQKFK